MLLLPYSVTMTAKTGPILGAQYPYPQEVASLGDPNGIRTCVAKKGFRY